MKYARHSLTLALLLWAVPAFASARIPIGAPVTVGQAVKINASGQAIPTAAATDHVVGVARTGATVTGTFINVYTQGETALCDCLAGAVRGEFLAVSGTAGSGDAGTTARPTGVTIIGIVTEDRNGSGECEIVIAPSAFTQPAAGTHPVDLTSDVTGLLPPANAGLGVNPAGFTDGLVGVASGVITDIDTLAELNTAISSGLVTGAHTVPLTVEEQDALPSVGSVTQLNFNNASVTDEGAGVVSVQTGWSRARSARGTLFECTAVNDSDPVVTFSSAVSTTVTYTTPITFEDVITDLDSSATVGEIAVRNTTDNTIAFVSFGNWDTTANTFIVTSAGDISTWVATDTLTLDADTDGRSNNGISIDLTTDIAAESMTGATHALVLYRMYDTDEANTWGVGWGSPSAIIHNTNTSGSSELVLLPGLREWHNAFADQVPRMTLYHGLVKLTATDVLTFSWDARAPLTQNVFAYVFGYANLGE